MIRLATLPSLTVSIRFRFSPFLGLHFLVCDPEGPTSFVLAFFFDGKQIIGSHGFPLSAAFNRHKCHLGEHAKMIACQSPERWLEYQKETEDAIHGHYFRALLHVSPHSRKFSMSSPCRDVFPPSAQNRSLIPSVDHTNRHIVEING